MVPLSEFNFLIDSSTKMSNDLQNVSPVFLYSTTFPNEEQLQNTVDKDPFNEGQVQENGAGPDLFVQNALPAFYKSISSTLEPPNRIYTQINNKHARTYNPSAFPVSILFNSIYV